MLHLHFAPSLDLLVPELLAGMRKVWTDPFAPPSVIVPNPAVGTWLALRLADGRGSNGRENPRAFGCIANLEMQTLEQFLWKALRPADGMRLLDVAVLRQVVCALLDEKLLADDTYSSIRRYLAGTGGAIDPVKRVQLASRIARGFLEYEYNRPSVWDNNTGGWRSRGIDASWLEDRCPDVFRDRSDVQADERWQRDLYRRVHTCLDLFPAGKGVGRERYISLPHLYRERRQNAAAGGIPWEVRSGTMFIFGVSKVSHFHRNTLTEISQAEGVDLHVLLTNPCAEFWEDVNTSRRPRRTWNHDSEDAGIKPRKPEEYNQEELANLPRDHELLELWGSAGKENVFLWCPQAAWNFTYACPEWIESEEAPETLLKSVQRTLLRRQSRLPARSPDGASDDDGSLRVLACPDPGREIEELREEILDLAHAKKIDRLDEIAVYLPDPGAYAPYIERVFGAGRPGDRDHIPFTILGTPGSDSVFSQGMQAVFALVEGRFDRARVFEFLRNPLVQASRGISPDQVSVWENWAEELGIYRGCDRAHRIEMGDRGQAATDAHTFELGIARMLIGGLAAGPVELEFTLQENDCARAAIPPFRDFAAADSELLEKFCATVGDLRADLKNFRAAIDEGLPGALDLFAGFVWSWFGTVPDAPGQAGAAEGRVRREFVDSLMVIKRQEELAGRGMVPMQELLAHMKSCLPGELPAVSSAWVNGITFAPLSPAMIVPHRVIVAAGLDALAFPGANERPAWDLMSHTRIIGDSDRVRDNRFAFLELLHAARERLVLSFRGRDMQKEEALQPSSVILELESFLRKNGRLAAGDDTTGRCAVRRDVPWIVHESLDAARRAGRVHGSWNAIDHELALPGSISPARRAAHRSELSRAPAGGVRRNAASGAPLRAAVADLQKFFANPLEYHLSKTLGIDLDEEPGTAGATDEPLGSGNLAMSILQDQIWTGLLCRAFPADRKDEAADDRAFVNEAGELAGQVYEKHLASGRSPEAQFCRMEKQALRAWAQGCPLETMKLRKIFDHHVFLENRDVTLGRPGAGGEVALPGNGGIIIECRHRRVLVPREWKKSGNVIGIIALKKSGEAVDNPDLWMAGTVQWLAEKRKYGDAGNVIRLVQLNRDDDASISAMKQEGTEGRNIEVWLAALVKSMAGNACSDHLPFGVIRKLYDRNSGWTDITADAVNEDLESDHSGYRCYLEAFSLTDARIPDVNDTELQALARERYAPMLERWLHE